MARPAGYLDLLRNTRFLLFEISATAAAVGYSVYAISVPWLALTFSGGLLLVGVVIFVEYGIYTLTFLIAPFVDRAANKRTIFLTCYPLQAVAAAGLGYAVLRGELTTPLLLGSVVFLSFLWDFTWAAGNVVPPLLLEPDQLFRGQGLGGLLGGATQIVGFVIGAALIETVGPGGGLELYAALLAVGAAVASVVSLPAPSHRRASTRYWEEFRRGWTRFARGAERSLLQLGVSEVVRGVLVAAPVLLITVIAGRVAAENVRVYGTLFVSWTLGGVLAGLVLGQLNPRHRIGPTMVVAALVEGALLLPAVTLSPLAPFSLAIWFGIGAAGAVYVSAVATYLRGAFPVEEMGRITSNLYLFTGVSSAAGAAVLGLLADRWSALSFDLLVAGGMLAVGLLVAALPRVRHLSF